MIFSSMTILKYIWFFSVGGGSNTRANSEIGVSTNLEQHLAGTVEIIIVFLYVPLSAYFFETLDCMFASTL